MFDFLSEDTDGQSIRRSAARQSKRKVMPVIRKPVPISKSGPLLPPKPGDPVEPPPLLTTGMAKNVDAGERKKTKISDDLDFLDETTAEVPDLRPAKKTKSQSNQLDNVRPLHKTGSIDKHQSLEQEFKHLELPRKTNDKFEFETDWSAGHAAYEDLPEENPAGWLRWVLLASALVLLAGGGFYAYSAGYFNELIASTNDEFEPVGDSGVLLPAGTPAGSSELPLPASVDTFSVASEPDSVNVAVELTLFDRFRTQLAAIESMVEYGSLEAAEQALVNMDRSVYGYGIAEFSAIENQIVLIRSKQGNERDAVELIEAERVDQLRLANEAEQLRQDAQNAEIAAVETTRLEQILIEAEKAKLAQAKVNEERAAKASSVVQTTREIASTTQGELELSSEQVVAELAVRNADKIRLDDLEEVAREEARRQITSADKLATDRRIAEERAVAQRQVAREARFKRAREIQAVNAAAKAAEEASVQTSNVSSRVATRGQELSSSSAPLVAQVLPISDDDLQTVYRRFTDLQNAISDRDISTVVKLTERSGLRVQQFMQIFENSVGIDVRIRNVSTSNATGEINGTLQIRSIKRSDGTLAAPPADLESITVKTKREGDDWSVIRW